MAGKTVQIPAEVVLKVANSAKTFKEISEGYQEALSGVDLNSSLGKNLDKSFGSIDKIISKLESLTGKQFFTDTDLKRAVTYMDQITEAFSAINSKTKGISAEALGVNTEELQRAKELLIDIKKNVRTDKKKPVGQVMDPNQLQAFGVNAKDSKFNAGKSYDTNIKNMGAAVGELSAKYLELKSSAEAAAAAELAAANASSKAANNLKTAKVGLENRKSQNDFLVQTFSKVKGTGGSGENKRYTEDVIADYQNIVGSLIKTTEGGFTDSGRDFASIISSWFKIDISDVQDDAEKVVQTLKEGIRRAATKTDRTGNEVLSAKQLQGTMKNIATNVQQGNYSQDKQVSALQQNVTNAEEVAAKAVEEHNAASVKANEATSVLTQTSNLLEQIKGQVEELKRLRKEYDSQVDAKYKSQLEAQQKVVKQQEEADKRGVTQYGQQAVVKGGEMNKWVHGAYDDSVIEKQMQAQAQADANAFKSRMQGTINRWFGAYQIINKIRQGVRQAWTDIQGLDKAMTNIAVVTDMSVGDLWGKINEYMSLAQQYGVTTQGVYEVSQLYYQQGLGTEDVMAATTETLKMARIAGMDYAEAADAMTVAIRSFKMEMEDAAHVTDVYSKVAAVTASDSEELATAMSKTASSAESVGSSFENTTAMLAVMIETTRESAQNLGSALKSIISRYGEMKSGLTQDSEGEEIDYNKTDAALRSVGISLKDAQGQFRDFDEVIFELAEKWDTLDKNTQRYIATVMAGNRQQSRFIALVDNSERLQEVANAAQNSEDAGLIQYAKTMDSLETKLNSIKTSFQEFYMSIINGPVAGGFLDFINNFIQGINQLGSLQGIFNLISVIRGLKSSLSLIGTLFGKTFGGIVGSWKTAQDQMVMGSRSAGSRSAREYMQGWNNTMQTAAPGQGVNGSPNAPMYAVPAGQEDPNMQQPVGPRGWHAFGIKDDAKGKVGKFFSYKTKDGARIGQMVGAGAAFAGSALTLAGSAVAENDPQAGALMSAGGNALQGLSMGAAFGPWGMAIGGILGALSSLPGVIKAFDSNNQRQFEYEKAKEAAEKANIERAEKKDTYLNTKELLEKYDDVKADRNASEEDYQAWIDINNQLAEAYPQLISYIDAEGNAIVDVTNASLLLKDSMKQAADASKDYYEKRNLEYEKQIAVNEDYAYVDTIWYSGKSQQDIYKNDFGLDWDSIGENWLGNKEITAGTIVDTLQAHGTDMEVLLAAASGVQEAKDQLDSFELRWLDFLTSSTGLNGAPFVKKDGKIVAWDSHIENVIAGKTGLSEQQANEKKSLQDAIYWHGQESKKDDDLFEMEGATGVVEKYLASQGYETAEEVWDLENYDEIIKPLIDTYAKLPKSVQEKMGTLYGNLPDISLSDLEQKFDEYGLATDDPFRDIFSDLWFEQNYAQRNRYAQQFYGETYTEKLGEFADYDEWLRKSTTYKGQDSDEARKEFYEQTMKIMKGHSEALGDGMGEFFENYTTKEIEEYLDFLKREDAIIEKGGFAAEAAQGRKNFIAELIAKDLKDGQMEGLNEKDTKRFLALFNAENAGTQEWADALSDFEEEVGKEIYDFDSMVFENFNTYLNNLVDNLDDNIKSIDDLFTKQKNGFSFKEASQFFSKYGEIGETWEDLFEWTEDGRLVFSDVGLMAQRMAEKTRIEGENFKKNADTMLASFSESDKKLSVSTYWATEGDESFGDENYIARLESEFVNDFKFTKEQAASLVNWVISNGDATVEAFTQQLEVMGITSQAATEYYEKNIERIQKEAKKADFESAAANNTAILEGAFSAWKEGLAVLQSIDIGNISGEEAGKLIAANIFKTEDFEQNVDGSFSLTPKAQSALKDLPIWIQNLINSSIESNLDSSLEALVELADSSLSGDASLEQYGEAFSFLSEEWDWSLEAIKGAYENAMSQALLGNDEILRSLITEQIAHKYNIDPEQAKELYGAEIDNAIKDSVAVRKDAYVNEVKTFNELLLKKIDGTATFSELEELDDLGQKLDVELDDFTGNLIDDLNKYAQSIIDNSYLSYSDKKTALKDTYGTLFGAQAYQETYGYDSFITGDMASSLNDYTTAQKMVRTNKNNLTADQAADFASTLSLMTGLSPEQLSGSFSYDPVSALYHFEPTEEWYRETLAKILGIDDFANISTGELIRRALSGDNAQAAALASNAEVFEMYNVQDNFTKAVNIEELLDSTSESVESLASGTEMNIEEIDKLYRSIGIALSEADLLEKYKMTPEELAQDFIAAAGSEGSLLEGEDLSVLNDAMKRGAEALLKQLASIVDAAVEGTAGMEDLFLLAQKTGMDLSGKIIKTAEGYQLTSTGALEAYSLLANQSGNYADYGYKLAERYGGRIDFNERRNELFNEQKSINNSIETLGILETLIQTGKASEQNTKEQREINKKQIEELKQRRKLNNTQLKVLEEAEKAYKKMVADKQIDFMNQNHFNEQGDAFSTWLSTREAAENAITQAYKNGGTLDYNSAMNILDFIGEGTEGEKWTDARKEEVQAIVAGATDKEGNVNLLELAKQIFNIEDWEEFARLADQATDNAMKEQQRIANENADFIDRKTEFEKTGFTENIFANDGSIIEENLSDMIDAKTVENYARAKYGEDWQNILKNDENERKEVIQGLNELSQGWVYDPASGMTKEQHYKAYMAGGSASLEVEERLKRVEDHLNNLSIDDGLWGKFNEGLDEALQKAAELNALLGQTTIYNVSTDENGNVSLNVSSSKDLSIDENYRKELLKEIAGKYFGIEGDDTALENIVSGNIGGENGVYTLTHGGKTITVNSSYKEIGIEQDQPMLTYGANVTAVEEAIGPYRVIEGKIIYKTPRQAYQDAVKEAEQLQKDLVSGHYANEQEAQIKQTRLNQLQGKGDYEGQGIIPGLERDYPNLINLDSDIQVTMTLQADSLTGEAQKKIAETQEAINGNGLEVQVKYIANGKEYSDPKLIPEGTPVQVQFTLTGAEDTDTASLESAMEAISNLNSILNSTADGAPPIDITAKVSGNAVDAVKTINDTVDALNGKKIDITGTVTLYDGAGGTVDLQSLGWSSKAPTPLKPASDPNAAGNAAMHAGEQAAAAKAAEDRRAREEAERNKALSEHATGAAVQAQINADTSAENYDLIGSAVEDNIKRGDVFVSPQSREMFMTIMGLVNNGETNRLTSMLLASNGMNGTILADDYGSFYPLTNRETGKTVGTYIKHTDIQKIADALQIPYKTTRYGFGGEVITPEGAAAVVAHIMGNYNPTTQEEIISSQSSYWTQLAEKYYPNSQADLEIKSDFIAGETMELTLSKDWNTGVRKEELVEIGELFKSLNVPLNLIMPNGEKTTYDDLTAIQTNVEKIGSYLNNYINTGELPEGYQNIQELFDWINQVYKEAEKLGLEIPDKKSLEQAQDKRSEKLTSDTKEKAGNITEQTFEEIYGQQYDDAIARRDQAQQELEDFKRRRANVEDEYNTLSNRIYSNDPTIRGSVTEKEIQRHEELGKEIKTFDDTESLLQAKYNYTQSVVDNMDASMTEIETRLNNISSKATEIPITTDDQASAVLDSVKTECEKLKSGVSFDINGNLKINYDPSQGVDFSEGGGSQEGGLTSYAGNVNGIAYAEGNVDPLIAGANLANKTLVGELGPEMGVWGGQYHLLGAHGAEFVNLPSNAIVFNHRQTEGILKGQWGHRGKALVEGNALDGGTFWDGQIGINFFTDLINGLSKSGSGKKVEYTEVSELEEWYNLMRKITRLQAERNFLEAEYENLTSGHEQLDNIRARQKALHEEMAIQKRLLEYQKEELALQRKNIEQQSFWNKSLTFNEDGTLQSIFGNELGGGRGTFAFLDQLKQLDGSAQVEMLKKIGYSAVGRDGKALEGKDLVSQFISEYTEIVGDYNELQDTISETESTIEENTTAVNELEQQITDNQKELEKKVYDLIVEQAEREIEVVKKQNELIKEANNKYVKGLTDALNEEKNMYESNQAISDREALQRQLSLLRRSGGSASEIAELERQLDDTLKSEYFSAQEKMIQDITKANERQVELMERQIKIQEDSLTYQKENGVIWQQVYEVLDGSYESILDFLSGNSKEFFEASSLEQKTMLLDWAKMVGMYDEDRANKQATSDAKKQWENGEVQKMLQADTENDRWGQYQKLSSKDKTAAQEHYNTAYADARLSGMSEEDARKEAYDSMVERFRVDGDDLGIVRWDPHGKVTNSGGGSSGSGDKKMWHFKVDGYDYKYEKKAQAEAAKKSKIYEFENNYKQALAASSQAKTDAQKAKIASDIIKYDKLRNEALAAPIRYYSRGGIVDYTGLAMVHGSKTKPESFLNAEQTAQIREALEVSGNRSMLEDVRSSLQALQSTIKSITNIANNSETSSITIAPGAVVIEVAELADSYDVDTLSADVMNRIVNIANKRTTRSVNRR